MWGIQSNRGSARVYRPRSSENKVQPNFFWCRWCRITLHLFHKTGYTIVPKVPRGVSNKTSFHSIDFSSIVFVSFNPFWKFLRLGNSAWHFSGVNFWSRDFFWGFVGGPRKFLPPFDHPQQLKSGVPHPPGMSQ